MPITTGFGDLLDSDADVLVNTTNAVGVMGRGLALAFANRWPSIVGDYKSDCMAGLLKGGSCRLYALPEPATLEAGGAERRHQRQWAAFCTKHHWRHPSRYEWIESGLAELIAGMTAGGHRSVAIPPLGCGLGGLEWRRVEPMILDAFRDLDINVHMWAPDANPSRQLRLF